MFRRSRRSVVVVLPAALALVAALGLAGPAAGQPGGDLCRDVVVFP